MLDFRKKSVERFCSETGFAETRPATFLRNFLLARIFRLPFVRLCFLERSASLKTVFFYGKAQKMIAEEQMEKVGISSLSRRRFTELSGGQQQRTLLARALCAAKKLIFLDEPVSALDPAAAKEFYAILEKLNDEGLSVVMVSHDLDCLDYASHILSFRGGKVQFESRADFCKDTSSGKSDEKRN